MNKCAMLNTNSEGYVQGAKGMRVGHLTQAYGLGRLLRGAAY